MKTEMMNIGQADLTMTSLELAELTGKRHDHVKADIEKMLKTLGSDIPSFREVSTNNQNQKVTFYKLPKDLTLTLITGYSIPIRHKVNQRFLEQESQPKTQAQLALQTAVALVEIE